MKIGKFFKNSYLELTIILFSLVILKEKVKKNVEGTALEYHHADHDSFRAQLFLSALSEGSGFGCVVMPQLCLQFKKFNSNSQVL